MGTIVDSMSLLTVKKLQAENRADWDNFVNQSSDGTFFHLSGWQNVIARSFGHSCEYIFAENGGSIVGVLPLVHVKSRLFGNALISTPFCVYGGIVTDEEEARSALLARAIELAEARGVDYLELRNRDHRHESLLTKELYVTFRKPITGDSQENLLAIPKKQRAIVRKGLKSDLDVNHGMDLDTLYDVYATSVRNLGTPVFGKAYLKNLIAEFPESSSILTLENQGTPVTSVLSFTYKGEILPYYGGGTAQARALRANDLMYWRLMEWAVENDIGMFDFGRSKEGTGSYRFKKHWGFSAEPLYYQYHLVGAEELPNLSPTNPTYQRLISAWKRMPVALTKLVGPPIAKYLG